MDHVTPVTQDISLIISQTPWWLAGLYSIPLHLMCSHYILYRYSPDAWAAQLSVDREAALHKTVETYWVWNNKAEMVRRVVEQNPFNSNLFFWVDIGYLRTSGGR